MIDENGRRLVAISKAMFERKRAWDTWCQELADYYYPLRGDFTRTLALGTSFASRTMDGTTINVRQTLGNSIDSMLRQGDWFDVTTGDITRDKQQDNALALDWSTKKLRSVIRDRRANWDRAVKEADQDWVLFGMPALSVEYNMVGRHLVHRAWHPRDVAIAESAYGRVDTVHRKARMTARQMCQMMDSGSWNGTLDPSIRTAAMDEPYREFDVLHILMPARDYAYHKPPPGRQTAEYVSLYVDVTHQMVLNERPTRVFNYVIPRWFTLGGNPYGFSPVAVNSLPDGRMLQRMALTILEQAEKAVDPPIVLGNEFLGRDFGLYAGGSTFVDLGEGNRRLQDIMSTIDTAQGIQVGLELKTDIRQMLNDSWLLNKLFLPDLKEMTAYEASVRTEEFRRAALPFFTPIQSEFHSTLLGVDWDMSCNVGLIDTEGFPEDLLDKDIVFQFTSPLEEAEGQRTVAAFQQSMSIVASGAAVDPAVAKQFDIIEATIDAVRGSGASPNWLLPADVQAANKQKAAQDAELADQANKLAVGSQIAQQLSGGVMAARQAGIIKGPPGAVQPGA